jgi:site-specific DNA recombinase
MNKKAVGYVRVSTEEQVKEGISLEAQTARIQAFALAKGWNLIKIIEDRGFSGKNLERPGMKELLADCEKKGIDVIVVFKVDRLTRKQKDLWYLLEDVFNSNDVGFVSVTEPFDTTTATGKAFLGMLGVFAQLERDLISERTVEALNQKKKQGEWLGRQPTGFKISSNGKLEIDQDMIRKIQRAKRLKREGKSFGDISKVLDIPKTTIYRLVNANLKSLKAQYSNTLN